MSLSTGCVLNVDASAIESGISRDRNHHTLTPTDTTTVRGKAGKGTLFNGTTSFVDCGNDSSLNITDALSTEAWLYPTVASTLLGILKKALAWDSGTDNMLRLSADNTCRFAVFDTTDTYRQVDSLSTYQANEWLHLVGTKNTNGIMKVYINGIESGSANWGAFTNRIDSASLIIGLVYNANYFNGTISSVKIYNYALSPTQIKRNYLSKAYLYVSHPVRIP